MEKTTAKKGIYSIQLYWEDGGGGGGWVGGWVDTSVLSSTGKGQITPLYPSKSTLVLRIVKKNLHVPTENSVFFELIFNPDVIRAAT